MSRAFDLLLLALIGLFAWQLLRSDSLQAASTTEAQPVTAKVRIAGDASLEGLGLLLMPASDLQMLGGANVGGGITDAFPHQLAPFMRDRTTQILVPKAGRYKVRWGIQNQGPPPRRPSDVMLKLAPEAKAPEQTIEVNDRSLIDEIVIELPPAHAAGLRQQLD